MTFINQTFSEHKNKEFFTVLRERVSDYFTESKLSKNGNTSMAWKTVAMFAIYFVPYFILISGVVTNPVLIVLHWVMMGFGMAGIGLSVMHDANHRAYSSKMWVNKLMGQSMNLIGANSEIWKIQHNRLHHTFTNIEGADDDINTPFILRFSPNKKLRWIHKFQFIYVWFFYGISTLLWVTTKEFFQAYKYKKMGLIRPKKFKSVMTQLVVWKLFYYLYMLVIPLWLVPAPVWLIIVSFICMQFTTGIILSAIFQTAHVMPDCEFPVSGEDNNIENNWAVHQLLTTSNYSPNNRTFSWLIGGLNFQIEHHLFPSICHVHYRDLSKIVSKTAEEYNIPYNSQKNFITAIRTHMLMLYRLGRYETAAAIH